MENSRPRWEPTAILLTLAILLGCQGISSSKNGLAPGTLAPSPSALSFGNIQVGNNQQLSETVTNNGGANVNISRATVAGTGFSMSGLNPPLLLTPGQHYTFSVTFTPPSSGNDSGSVSIVSNASDSNLSIPLSGTATPVSQGQLAVTPTTMAFGNVAVGTNAQLIGTLSASGASVKVTSAIVNNSAFAVTGLSFPVTIPAGQHEQFTVTFTPPGTGVASGSISFTSNASNSPAVESPTGTGIIPARTDVISQPYPNPIPCPSSAGCSGGGALTGASYQFTPSDFPSTPIVRITDVNTTGSPQHTGSNTSCDAGSEVNDWNTLDTRFTICGTPQHQLLYAFNPATNTATQSTSFSLAISSSAYFSYTQPYIMYHAHACPSGVTGCAEYDLGIFSYDTTCAGGITTCNPSPVLLVDISTACGITALQGNVNAYPSTGVTVSADDQTFGVPASSTVGQGSSGNIYAIVWNRTNGCMYWNTATGQYFLNGTLVGTVGITDTFTLHNLRLGKSGLAAKVEGTVGTCGGTCPGLLATTNKYFWTVGTSTVTYTTSNDGCGHSAIGYNLWVNKCEGSGDVNGLYSATFSAASTLTSLPVAYPSPDEGNGAHISWADDNSTDTAPFFAMFQNGVNNFTATYAWDSELLGVSTNGSGVVYRFAHTYATAANSPYVPGAISQDGKYLLWTTDWDSMLGSTDGVSESCTPGTNCRTDVFMAILPIIQ